METKPVEIYCYFGFRDRKDKTLGIVVMYSTNVNDKKECFETLNEVSEEDRRMLEKNGVPFKVNDYEDFVQRVGWFFSDEAMFILRHIYKNKKLGIKNIKSDL